MTCLHCHHVAVDASGREFCTLTDRPALELCDAFDLAPGASPAAFAWAQQQ